MTAVAQSKVVVGRELPDTPAPLLRAFGDPDDHLRLCTLIAESVETRIAPLREEAKACLEPRTPWRVRLGRVRNLVRNARAQAGQWLFVLHDLDGISPPFGDPSRAWDDREFVRERDEFFGTVLDLVMEGGWFVVRPQPIGKVTVRLEAFMVREATAPLSEAAIESLAPVSPDCRRVLQWLRTSGALSEGALDDLIHETMDSREDDLERQILRVAYDHLPAAARGEAQRLTALRVPVAKNGTLGPYGLAESPAGHEFSEDVVNVLVERGFLQEEGSGQVRMPRSIRATIRTRALAEDPERVTQEHGWLAEQGAADTSVSALVETHYHAVAGMKADLALKTSSYYGADLRELAFHLSERREFDQAAKLYRKILDDFDPDDTYACEYYAYNLARLDAVAYQAEIRSHYGRAHALDLQNPLFHGRWLGFRGRFGEDIAGEFDAAMHDYLQSYGGHSAAAVDRFASEVLKALRRGNREAQRNRLVSRWRSQLARIRTLAPMLE